MCKDHIFTYACDGTIDGDDMPTGFVLFIFVQRNHKDTEIKVNIDEFFFFYSLKSINR